jgi:hypothetical protein
LPLRFVAVPLLANRSACGDNRPAKTARRPSNRQVDYSVRRIALPVSVMAMLWFVSGAASASAQDATPVQQVSLEHVKGALDRTPPRSLRFDARMPVPAATFKVTVRQQMFVPPILDTLRKGFELTPLQRQSAEWASQCCGLSLAKLTDSVERAFRRMEERRIHERVTRELADVVAAGKR